MPTNRNGLWPRFTRPFGTAFNLAHAIHLLSVASSQVGKLRCHSGVNVGHPQFYEVSLIQEAISGIIGDHVFFESLDKFFSWEQFTVVRFKEN